MNYKKPTLKQMHKADLLWELDRATETGNQRRRKALMLELIKRDIYKIYE